VATLERVQGSVLLLAGTERRPARAGDLLTADRDVLVDKPDGAAVITYPDGTRLELSGGTRARLGADPALQVRLLAGRVFADVKPQPAGRPMTLSTSGADARVLGTRLTFGIEGDATRLEVHEGRVRLTRRPDGATVDVTAGHFAVAATGVALLTRPLALDKTLALEVEEFGTGRAVRPAEGALGRLFLEPLAAASGGRCVAAPGVGTEVSGELQVARGAWYLWIRYRDDDNGAPSFEVRVNDRVVERVTADGKTKNWLWRKVGFPAEGRLRIALRSTFEGVRQTNPKENLKENPYNVVNRWDQIVLTRDAGFSPEKK
jgi:hypothetical protein